MCTLQKIAAALLAGVLAPVYAPFLRWSGIALRKAWQYTCIGSVWFWSRALVPFARLAWRGICVAAVWLWMRYVPPTKEWKGWRKGMFIACVAVACVVALVAGAILGGIG